MRRISTNGNVSLFAGGNGCGRSGDGGPATSAKVGWVVGLAFDSQGMLRMKPQNLLLNLPLAGAS